MPIKVSHNIDWEAYRARLNDIPIEDVLAALGVDTSSLAKGKGHVKCPVHNDSEASLFVYPDNTAYCYGACRQKYGPVWLYKKATGLDYKQACDNLAHMFGIRPEDTLTYTPVQRKRREYDEKKYGLPSSSADVGLVDCYHQEVNKDDRRMWLKNNWLVDDFIINKFRLGHTLVDEVPAGWSIPVWDRELERLFTIRYRRDDEFYHGKEFSRDEFRNWVNNTKYWGEKGRNGVYPFGLWMLDMENEFVVLAESEKSILLMTQYGIPALTLTTGVMGHPEAYHVEYHNLIDHYPIWIVMFDDQEAGNAAASIMQQLYPNRVAKFRWPEGYWPGDDPVDYFGLYGLDDFLERIDLSIRDFKNEYPDFEKPTLIQKRRWAGWDSVRPIKWVG